MSKKHKKEGGQKFVLEVVEARETTWKQDFINLFINLDFFD
jgi:hypothetical protein